jgi:hypothetical protein
LWLSTERRDVEVDRREHFEEEKLRVLRRSCSPCELRVEHSLNLSASVASRASLLGCQIVSVSVHCPAITMCKHGAAWKAGQEVQTPQIVLYDDIHSMFLMHELREQVPSYL